MIFALRCSLKKQKKCEHKFSTSERKKARCSVGRPENNCENQAVIFSWGPSVKIGNKRADVKGMKVGDYSLSVCIVFS